MMMIRSTAAAVVSAVVLVAGVAVGVVSSQGSAKAGTAKPSIAVFKSPTCGCCAKWNDHLKAAGFTVNSTDRTDMSALKDEYKIPSALRSCHTGLVAGYVVEGHVPADVVAKLLSEKPAGVVGIAVPGMPVGSPGMESADGSKTPYDVMAFTKDGQSRIYASVK
jgi:hypothetical protein